MDNKAWLNVRFPGRLVGDEFTLCEVTLSKTTLSFSQRGKEQGTLLLSDLTAVRPEHGSRFGRSLVIAVHVARAGWAFEIHLQVCWRKMYHLPLSSSTAPGRKSGGSSFLAGRSVESASWGAAH